jgi:hypothetical protein
VKFNAAIRRCFDRSIDASLTFQICLVDLGNCDIQRFLAEVRRDRHRRLLNGVFLRILDRLQTQALSGAPQAKCFGFRSQRTFLLNCTAASILAPDYDEWFSLQVDKGLAAADRGEFVEHGDMRKIIDSRYPA